MTTQEITNPTELLEGIGGLFETAIAKLAPAQESPASTSPLTALANWPSEAVATMEQTQVVEKMPDGSFQLATRGEIAARELNAEMNAAILAPIERSLNDIFGLGVPWGSLAVGGGFGLIIGEVIDGVAPPFGDDGSLQLTNVLVKSAAGIGVVMLGKTIMTKQATTAAAAVIATQILADVLPVDRLINWIIDLFGGGAGSSQSVLRQAEQVVRNAQGGALHPSAHDQLSGQI